MPMTQKELLIAGGGALVVGIVAMYALRKPAAAAGVQPQAATPANSLGVPSMPVASIAPAPINIEDAPYYQTVNITPPPVRNQIPKQKQCPPKDDCACGGGFGVGPVLSDSQIGYYSGNVSRSFGAVVPAPNMEAQFPRNLYPWMYQNPAPLSHG